MPCERGDGIQKDCRTSSNVAQNLNAEKIFLNPFIGLSLDFV